MSTAGELIVRCFHARTSAHILHLKTKSYAAHKALNDFYDGIVGLADAFAEAYIGENGMITSYSAPYKEAADGVRLMTDLAGWIEHNRDEVCESSMCQNLIDEILTLIYSTKYKLVNLK